NPEAEYWYEQRVKVKPGITGLWQISGRSTLGFNEMIRHDMEYIRSWSLWMDVVILAKTIPAVLRRRGAY
ncbi:MAG: sugar transferase, partial [Myxococcota bacterium]|nr:sugar transferase [Myxococcota bacterium]